MPRTHITLPSLQVAATAFLAFTSGCHAELYCVDKATSEVVAAENCEGDVGDFTTVEGAPNTALGAVIANRQDTNDDDDDDDIDVDKYKRDVKTIAEVAARMNQMKLVTGGFGNRDTCDCSNGRGGGGIVGGAGGIAGTGGRRGGNRGG